LAQQTRSKAVSLQDPPVQSPATAAEADNPPSAGRRRLFLLLPLAVFLGLAALFLVRLFSGDPSRVPSALINRPVPTFSLPPLEGLVKGGVPVPGLSSGDLTGPAADGRVTIVNVFASWCVPCRQEHPLLLQLAQDPRVRLVGINYKDDPDNARRFLGELGNPFAAVGTDTAGRTAIDWGVYGVPETFIVGPDGIIRYKNIGPLTPQALQADIEAAIKRASGQ
jgi:cytochrome c biogenesis protein CcmG/thiol:disulfide interchange protein DsbE